MYLYFQNNIFCFSSKHSILQSVPIVLTISSIILTAVFVSLQQFSEKYPDFIYIIQSWKNKTIYLFFMLLVYSILSFIAFYNEKLQYNLIILIFSIYLTITLFLMGVKSAFLMNNNSIISIHKCRCIGLIKKIPKITYVLKLVKENKLMNQAYNRDFINFFKYQILGINKVNFYTSPKEKLDEIKKC